MGGVEGVEGVFGVAAAGDEKGAEADGVGAVGALGGAAEFFCVGGAEDADGEWVVEDDRGVVQLVGGSAEGDAEGGAGWGSFLHFYLSLGPGICWSHISKARCGALVFLWSGRSRSTADPSLCSG